MSKHQLIDTFSTPIMTYDFEDQLLADIQNDITEKMPQLVLKGEPTPWSTQVLSTWSKQVPDIIESWQLAPLAQGVIEATVKLLGDMGYEGNPLRMKHSWMNWVKPGGWVNDHVHPNSSISGIYFFQTTGADGDLTFSSPNAYTEMGAWPYDTHLVPRYTIEPKVGRMVLFPSWLRHRVETNSTDHERISVNFTLV